MIRTWGRGASPFKLAAGAALALAACALVAYDARYHEFWRDEVHPILLAQNVPLRRFLLAKKVEGFPPLFDLLSMPFVRVLSPEQRLLLGGGTGFAVLLFGTYRCIASICARPVASLVLTALIGASYSYAYEFGVVIRPYALSAGFGLLANAYLRDALRTGRARSVVLGTLAAGLCALSSTHAATLAGGALVAFGLVSLWRDRSLRRVLPTLGVLPFFAVVAYVILPFPGRSSDLNVDMHRSGGTFLPYAMQAIAGSFTPQDWWVAASFGEPGWLDRVATFRHWAPIGIAAGFMYSVVLRSTDAWREYRPVLVYDVLAILVGWAPLLEIVVNHYWGSPRHHQFFSIPVVVTLAGWGAQRGMAHPRSVAAWAPAVALPLMGAWFAYQYVVCAEDLALDAKMPFSDTKAAAALLPTGAHLVAESLTMQEGYMLWQPGIVMRGGDCAGRHLGYTAFDTVWHSGAPIPPMVRDECAAAPDRTYFSGNRFSTGGLAGCLHSLFTATPHSEQLRPDERFDLWQADCACVEHAK
jgi:hypothetical protein